MPANGNEPMRELAPEEFRDVIGHFASGVTVITAAHEGEWFGTTASAVSSLSLEPPMLLVCMNKSSATGQAIEAGGRFGVNILSEEQPEVALRFARQGGDFEGIATETGSFGEPLLADALATLECRVTEDVTGGTHTVFIAAVDSAGARSGVAPLAYFRGEFGRLELGHDETALNEIRSLVVTGELAAGSTIDLAGLAAQLQIPSGSAYHALGKLVGEGLVEREGGAFAVVPMNLATVEDALDCRLTIELGVIEETIGGVEAERVAELRAALEAAPAGARDPEAEIDREFRRRFVSLASPSLARSYERLSATALIAAASAARGADGDAERERDEFTRRAQEGLVAAYEQGDREAARLAVGAQVDHLREFARRHLGEPA